MHAMTEERRLGPDRRRHARGGRRPDDRPGYSPLVMVVDSDHRRRELCEAILAKLQFAVAPIESVDKAVSIAHALRPSVIVCPTEDASRIRARIRIAVPIVPLSADLAITDALVQVVRAAIGSATV